MTRLNFTFQEASPLITYSGWVEGSSSNDTLSSLYNGSFRVTFTDRATASFAFTGTAVSIFGSTRSNHGRYSVNLDQEPLFSASGGTPQGFFNKSLWHADDLPYAEHKVVLTNLPVQPNNKFLDLDYVSIERQIGQDGDEISQNTLDDDSSAVEYLGTWVKTNRDTANAGTLHMTNVGGSQAVITFNGCCLELYGHYANAPYSVKLDNQVPVNLAGFDIDPTPEFQHPRTLLYLVDGLSKGNHTVTLTNTKSNVNRPFFFDYAVVSDAKNATSNGNRPGGNTERPGGSLKKADIPVAAIVEGVIGAVAFLALLILVFFLMRRRRHRAEREKLDSVEESDLEPKPYMPHDHLQIQNIEPARAHQQHEINSSAYLPPSKRRQMANYHPRAASTSSEGLLSPRGQASEGGSRSYGAASSTGLGIGSRSAPRRQRDVKKNGSPSHTASGETSQHTAVQEEDAGLAISPEDRQKARSLPPAYNPEWHHRGGS